MFKRDLLLNILLPTLAVLPGAMAVAADTTINLTGTVVAAACTVDTRLVNGQEVDLGTLGRTKFQHPGDAGDWKSFTLNLTNCPIGTNQSTATFSGTQDGNDATLFANTEPASTAATNIAVQVADDNNRSTLISHASVMTTNVDSARNATFPLAARLYTPVGGVQAGKVSSTVLVNFTYQ